MIQLEATATYDPRARALYVYLPTSSGKDQTVETESMPIHVYIDRNVEDEVCGVEMVFPRDINFKVNA